MLGRPLAIASLIFGLNACVGASPDGAEPVTDLSQVLSNPLAFDGKSFRGHVFVYLMPGSVIFTPRPIGSPEDLRGAPAVLLLGEESSDISRIVGLKSGDGLLLQGRLEPAKRCFIDHTCVPWEHPILLMDVKVLGSWSGGHRTHGNRTLPPNQLSAL
jgi:hypothetical protein